MTTIDKSGENGKRFSTLSKPRQIKSAKQIEAGHVNYAHNSRIGRQHSPSFQKPPLLDELPPEADGFVIKRVRPEIQELIDKALAERGAG